MDAKSIISSVVAGVITGALTGLGTLTFASGSLYQRIEQTEEAIGYLRKADEKLYESLNRMDREGTMVSKADKIAITELKSRLDRMETNQNVGLAQGARNEALLLDLKNRLRQ